MEIKLKEQVNVNSLTFKKRVIEEAIELLGRKRNYIDNDIDFVVMITFVNGLAENNVVIESLYDEANLETKISTEIEPLFEKEVLNKEDRLAVYKDIVSQMKEYMKREAANRVSIAGVIYDLLEELGNMPIEDLVKNITSIISSGIFNSLNSSEEKEVEPKQTDEEIKQEVLEDIDNLKMKALIEKFTRENKEDAAK